METIHIYIEEAKPKKKSKWFKNWSCDKKVKEVKEVCYCTCRKPVTKKLVKTEYDFWNDETTYTFEYFV